jgi:hypothetical protein
MEEVTDRSSDGSDDESDELEEAGDDVAQRRALSSSVIGEPMDLSGTEL